MPKKISNLEQGVVELDDRYKVDISLIPTNLPAMDQGRSDYDDRSIEVTNTHGSIWFNVRENTSGSYVANAVFAADDKHVRCDTIEVKKEHRSRGIARRLYQIAADVFDAPVVPSDNMTLDAEAFWGDREQIPPNSVQGWVIINIERSDALLRRALSFINASDALVSRQDEGWLFSSLLLQGFAAELVAKKRLYEMGKSERELRNDPFGHNILRMWRDHTDLLAEALSINDTFEIHFIALDAAHTKASNYAIRYGGDFETPDPRVVAPVLKEIIRRERMRHEQW